MPRDLTDLLAEALPRDTGAPDLGAIESRVARRRVGRLGAAVLALAAAVAVGVQALPIGPPAPMIDQVEDTAPAGTTLLPLPAAGEVAAAHANGRPVFVVHSQDGDVRVLDAISPHPGDGMQGLKVLAYCTRSGWFEELWHGSKFAGNGAWVGGPAPYGLAEHTVVATTPKTVTVGAMAAAPTRQGLAGEEPTGEGCIDVIGDNEAPSALVLHDPAAEDAIPGLLYPEVHDGEVVLPDEPQLPLAGPDATLPLPAPGEVSADHVNGRPVFVRNDGGGDVFVLDAVNPHVTEFGPKVLAWCLRGSEPPNGDVPAVGLPVDLWYSSAFTPHGAWGTGRAPTGLGRVPVRAVTTETVTVAGAPLLAPPRVQDPDGTTPNATSDGCSQAVSLFPDWPAADPTILDDLVLHEPLFPDDWWYPTPARILGEEPGLPPDEQDRYLEATGLDPDRLDDLDLAELPALGDVGLAVQREAGVELLALDGSSHGLLRGASLEADAARDGLGGPVLLRTSGGRLLWVDPSRGATLSADGVTVLQGNEALVDRGDGTHESLTAYGPDEDGPTVVPGPLRVSNGHRLVSGPDCEFSDGATCGDGTRIIDTDVGGVGTTTPGCNPADGFADFNLVSTCSLDASWLELDVMSSDGPLRIDVPRYPGQPDDQPTIGHFRNAVFGGPGVVAQLSLECEVPAVVGFELGGTPVDLWGGDAWSDGATSILLGTTVLPDGQARVPLVQVAAGACGDTKGVPEGVWAITDAGPVQLNDITDPVALWTGTTDLSQISRQLEVRTAATSACATTDEVVQGDDMIVEVDDIDLDGDGATDRAVLASPGDPDAPLVACLADGRRATYDVGLVEVFGPVVLGGTDAVMVGATSVSAANVEIVRLIGDDLVALGEGNANGTSRSFTDGVDQDGPGDETWGCRPATEFGEVEIVTVRTEPVDGQARVTLTTYAVSAAALDLIEESSELRNLTLTMERSEANGIAAELGLRLLCRP